MALAVAGVWALVELVVGAVLARSPERVGDARTRGVTLCLRRYSR